jgi:hypothetical protein
MFIFMFDQQPVGSFFAFPAAHPHEDKTSLQTLALQLEFEVALLQSLVRRLVSFRLPIAAIPEHDGAATILGLGNGAFKVAIVERMIFDLDCQTFILRIKRRTFGDRP